MRKKGCLKLLIEAASWNSGRTSKIIVKKLIFRKAASHVLAINYLRGHFLYFNCSFPYIKLCSRALFFSEHFSLEAFIPTYILSIQSKNLVYLSKAKDIYQLAKSKHCQLNHYSLLSNSMLMKVFSPNKLCITLIFHFLLSRSYCVSDVIKKMI